MERGDWGGSWGEGLGARERATGLRGGRAPRREGGEMSGEGDGRRVGDRSGEEEDRDIEGKRCGEREGGRGAERWGEDEEERGRVRGGDLRRQGDTARQECGKTGTGVHRLSQRLGEPGFPCVHPYFFHGPSAREERRQRRGGGAGVRGLVTVLLPTP